MKAMLLTAIGPIAEGSEPLESADLPEPIAGPGELRCLRVAVGITIPRIEDHTDVIGSIRRFLGQHSHVRIQQPHTPHSGHPRQRAATSVKVTNDSLRAIERQHSITHRDSIGLKHLFSIRAGESSNGMRRWQGNRHPLDLIRGIVDGFIITKLREIIPLRVNRMNRILWFFLFQP